MKQKYTPETYRKHVEKVTPNSKLGMNVLKAFLIGGLICMIGQGMIEFLKSRGFSQDTAGNMTTIILISLGALLTGMNVYDTIGKVAGAGSIVPITGFANSIVAPAMEFKSEGYVMGVGARMFVIAGPVIVYGVVTSVLSGFLYYVLELKL